MIRFSFKKLCLLALCLIGFASFSNAQQGNVTINQDPAISTLLDLKTEINVDGKDSRRYKIQIFSGDHSKAEEVKTAFKYSYDKWPVKKVYETPNYKVWVGNFRTKLEADRALVKIKKKFPSAFPFKPKKERD
jgi:hypothetical protein